MWYGRFFGKKSVQYVFLLGCCVIILVMCLFNVFFQKRVQGELQQLLVKSKDKEIEINWEPLYFSGIESVQIAIHGDDYSEIANINPSIGKYSFVKGTHGVLYTVSIMTVSNTGRKGMQYNYDRLFLDYSQLPDLPLIVIETENNLDPTYVNAIKTGSNLWGETITDNEYVKGVMSFGGDVPSMSCDAQIRVRGNTTAVNQDKKSYKIVLDEEYDLLGRGIAYEDREWLLLNVGTDLKTYIGTYLGTYLGLEWQPQMQYVNVIMNGDWKGCYLLSESVKRSLARCSISEEGYLFENDAYWWNSKEEYFKTSFQPPQLGFTVKYPDIKDKNDVRLGQLKKYMQIIEDKIMAADEDLFEYIDAESFVSWILVRDIMGQDDGGGSNIYYYIDKINWDNLSENKLKMGPLWDFDISFVREDDWSVQHGMEGLYFDYLLQNPEFRKKYVEKWKKIKDTLEDDLSKHLEELYTNLGEELQKSRKLNASRWMLDNSDIKDEMEYYMDWIERRIQWMSTAMGVE